MKYQSQKVSEVDVIPTHNRFHVLNNTDFNPNCASQCNDNTVCDILRDKLAKSKQNDGSSGKGKIVPKNDGKPSNNVVKQCQLANQLIICHKNLSDIVVRPSLVKQTNKT